MTCQDWGQDLSSWGPWSWWGWGPCRDLSCPPPADSHNIRVVARTLRLGQSSAVPGINISGRCNSGNILEWEKQTKNHRLLEIFYPQLSHIQLNDVEYHISHLYSVGKIWHSFMFNSIWQLPSVDFNWNQLELDLEFEIGQAGPGLKFLTEKVKY